MMEVKLFDVVALTVDLPEYNLSKGQVGTVVELLKNGAAYEVEFSDRNGRTYQSLVFGQITLWFYITNPKVICESQCQFEKPALKAG